MGSTVPRHSWQATGEVTTGPLGAVLIWTRCRWCGQIDTSERRRRLEACIGAPRIEPERPRGWWRRVLVAHGTRLPPEPAGGFPRIGASEPPACARIDDRDAAVPREGALPPAPAGAFPRA